MLEIPDKEDPDQMKTDKFFIKENLEYHAYYGSRCENNEQNMLLRLEKVLMKGITTRVRLSKFLVIVLDDNFVKFGKFEGSGIAGIIGDYLDSLIQNIQCLLKERKQQLPSSAKKDEQPVIYWVAAPHHKNFLDNGLRTKFNLCLESIVKTQSNMRVIKLKEIWEFDNCDAIQPEGVFTIEGAQHYWGAVDVAVRFNAGKWEEWLIRCKFMELQKKQEGNRSTGFRGRPHFDKFHWRSDRRDCDHDRKHWRECEQ